MPILFIYCLIRLISLPIDMLLYIEHTVINNDFAPRQVTTPTVDRPLKPVADVFMFIEDKKTEYKKKFPTMDENELHRFMVKEFNCISERDKVSDRWILWQNSNECCWCGRSFWWLLLCFIALCCSGMHIESTWLYAP